MLTTKQNAVLTLKQKGYYSNKNGKKPAYCNIAPM